MLRRQADRSSPATGRTARELARTNIAAFQQLWFDLAAAQLGFTGSVKWDAYWGKYDGDLQLPSTAMIGPAAEGWPLFPSYHALRLCSCRRPSSGWQVAAGGALGGGRLAVGVPDQPEKELAAYASTPGS